MSKKHPINENLTELVEDAYEYLLEYNSNEIEELWENILPGYRMLFGDKLEIETEQQYRRLALCYVSCEVERSYFSFKNTLNQDLSNSEVIKIYPELAKKFDKDGLINRLFWV